MTEKKIDIGLLGSGIQKDATTEYGHSCTVLTKNYSSKQIVYAKTYDMVCRQLEREHNDIIEIKIRRL